MDATPTADSTPVPMPEARDPASARRFEPLETALWIVGFLYQSLAHLTRYGLGFDQTVQLPTAQSALRGLGFGALTPLVTDLSTTQSAKITYWPPGWALVQVPFLAAFRNTYWATFLSDIAALALLLVAVRSLMNRLGDTLPAMTRVLLIFSFGFIATPNGDFWYANLWALVFFFGAAALVMPRAGLEAPDPAYFLAGWLLGDCVWMRYQYVPTVAAILLAILIDRRFWPGLTKIAFHVAGVATSVVPLLLWRLFPRPIRYHGPFDARAFPTSPGLHLRGLIDTVPPAGVALAGNTWQPQMLSRLMPGSLAGIDGPTIVVGLAWVLTLVAVIGAVFAVRDRRAGAPTRLNVRRFYAIGLSGYLLTFGLLAYLTVIHDVDVTHWAYVQITRYHIIVIVFVLVGLAHAASLVPGWTGDALKVIVAAVAAGLFLGNVGNVQVTFRRLARHDWGPPLERGFPTHGEATDFFAEHADPHRQNVLVHIGEFNNEASMLISMARYCGYSATTTTRPKTLDTVSPVHLILTTPLEGRPELRREFDGLCAELGPEKTLATMVLCDGRFMPRRRGGL